MEQIYFLPEIRHFSHIQCTPAWEIPYETTACHELVFVISGRGEWMVNDTRVSAAAGDILYFKPDTKRGVKTDPDQLMELYTVCMDVYDAGHQPASLPLELTNPVGTDKKIEQLLVRISQFYSLREMTCKMHATALIMTLLCHVFTLTGAASETGTDPRVRQAAAYVMDHLDQRISASVIGKAVRLHPGYLNRLTLKHTGRTLSSFISSIRVGAAEDALIYEGLSVSEAALRFGFSDIYHFSKVFKKYRGYSPSSARMLMR